MKRPTYVKKFGGEGEQIEVRLTEPSPLSSLRLYTRLVKAFGAKLLDIVISGGVYVGEGEDRKKIGVLTLLGDRDAMMIMAREFTEVIGDMGPEEVQALAEDLLIGQCEVRGDSVEVDVDGVMAKVGTWVALDEDDRELARAQIDAWWPDGLALIGTLWFALQSFFLPTSAAEPTDDATSAAKTEKQPAGT